MVSKTEENYLKTILSLEVDYSKVISTNDIAKKIKTQPSSVTDMLQKLALKKLVNYIKYKGVSLTEKGKKIAINIVRKHRLWETFLVEKLNFKWNEVHEVAEQLEHIKSDKLIANLDFFLEFPKKDPHGDPIPNCHGDLRIENTLLLSDSVLHKKYKIVGIKDSSASFLDYLDSLNIKINTTIEVERVLDFDNSLIVVFNKKKHTLSDKAGKNLFIN